MDLGAVLGVLQNGLQNLAHGCDTRTACNHAEALYGALHELLSLLDTEVTVAEVLEAANGALYINGVTNLQPLHVLRELAALWKLGVHIGEVHFNEEVKVTKVVVRGDGGVGALNVLPIDIGANVHVLADGKAKALGGVAQLEAENTSIRRHDNFLRKLELTELFWVECGLILVLLRAAFLGGQEVGNRDTGDCNRCGNGVLVKEVDNGHVFFWGNAT